MKKGKQRIKNATERAARKRSTPLPREEMERLYALDAKTDQVAPLSSSPAERKIVKRKV
jgi:hypothetical protein